MFTSSGFPDPSSVLIRFTTDFILSKALWASATIMLIWFSGWRLWRFHVAPVIWSNEPKPLPYWIPFIGHSWEFMHQSQKLFTRGYQYFPNGEPYALTIAGQTMIIIRSTQDIATLWKKTTTFTFDPFVENVMKAFGLHSDSIESMFHNNPQDLIPAKAKFSSMMSTDNPTGKCYFHMQKDWFRVQLHPGEHLRVLQVKYACFLSQSISWAELSDSYVVSSNGLFKVISLKRFCRQILGVCAMKAFFGTELFQSCPDILSYYQEFEDASWKVFYNYPRLLAKDLHKVKDQALDGLIKYFDLPKEKRPDTAWIFQTMDTELANLNLDARDRAGMMMMIIWALNHNAHKISFWIFAHLICNPTLLASVRSETEKALNSDGSLDVQRLLTESPQLDAVWFEVLRIYNNAAIARKATEDTTIGGISIHAGQTILGPFRQFHLNSNIFGPQASGFDASRFLKTKNLQTTKGYHPFGGGNTYCPGRFFARSEIYIFVATSLRRLHIEMVEGQELPVVDLAVPSSSAMPAVKDMLVKVKSRKSGEIS